MLPYSTLLQTELCSWVFFLCLCKIPAGKELGCCSGLGSAVAHTWWLWEGWFCCVGSADTDRARDTKYWPQTECRELSCHGGPWETGKQEQTSLLKTVYFHFLCVGTAWLIHVPAFCLLVICWFDTTNFSLILERSFMLEQLCVHTGVVFTSCGPLSSLSHHPGMLCNWRGSTSCAWHMVLMTNN